MTADLDTLLCRRWCDALVQTGDPVAGSPRIARELADQLRVVLAENPDARKLHVYAWRQDDARGCLRIAREPPAPNAQRVFTLPIAKWRAKLAAAVAASRPPPDLTVH